MGDQMRSNCENLVPPVSADRAEGALPVAYAAKNNADAPTGLTQPSHAKKLESEFPGIVYGRLQFEASSKARPAMVWRQMGRELRNAGSQAGSRGFGLAHSLCLTSLALRKK